MKHLQEPVNLIIDLHAFAGAFAGKHFYTLGLLNALRNHPRARNIQLHLVATTPLPSISVNNAAWHYFSSSWYYYKLSCLTKMLSNARLLSPTSFIPSLVSFCPTITIVYDTASISPQTFSRNPKAKLLESLLFPLVLKKSSHIVTISHAVAQEVAQVRKNAIPNPVVVYPQLRDFPEPQPKEIERITLEPHGYFLFVGTLEPRKNLVNLIAAYTEFLRLTRVTNPPKLVLAGQRGWHYSDIFVALNTMELRKMVVFVDSPTDSQLSSLYAQCLCFCYVSHYEGFGMPILEAMSFGKAVLASNISVFGEVAGTSALYVEPLSVTSIAHGLLELVENSALRHKLESSTKRQIQTLNQDVQMDQFISLLLG